MMNMSNKNIPCWATDIKNILFSTGFGDVWLNQGVQNDSLFLTNFLQRIVDINNQIWKTEIKLMNKISLYNEIKTDNEFEFHVTHIQSNKLRSLFSRFRCGCLNLQIHTGRHENIPRENRLCTFCNTHKIEDDFHFLLECPCFSEIRSLYIPTYFSIYPTKERFHFMLRTKNKYLLLNICLFLEKAWEFRSEIDSYI